MKSLYRKYLNYYQWHSFRLLHLIKPWTKQWKHENAGCFLHVMTLYAHLLFYTCTYTYCIRIVYLLYSYFLLGFCFENANKQTKTIIAIFVLSNINLRFCLYYLIINAQKNMHLFIWNISPLYLIFDIKTSYWRICNYTMFCDSIYDMDLVVHVFCLKSIFYLNSMH